MKLVITGAGGIVGRAVADLAGNTDWSVVSVLRPGGDPVRHPAISVDLAHERLLQKVPAADAVVHLAAALSHNRLYRDDEASGRITRMIDENIREYAKETGAYVVYASTCSLYDSESDEWKAEHIGVRPASSYQSAKYETERALLAPGNACVFRLSAPYGPGLFLSTVLARFLDKARRRETVEVWGSGSREQDFIHTRDVAKFVVAALNRRALGVYNVAAGRPTTMAALAKVIVAVIGKGNVVFTGQADPGEGHFARYSIAKAQAELGWTPSVALADGIREFQGIAFRE